MDYYVFTIYSTSPFRSSDETLNYRNSFIRAGLLNLEFYILITLNSSEYKLTQRSN
jgi:hypothetical protein